MPLSKAKRYSRFNVGEVMKARKKNREEVALAHTSVVKAKNIVIALNSKKRRLENKVIAVPFVLNYNRQSFYNGMCFMVHYCFILKIKVLTYIHVKINSSNQIGQFIVEDTYTCSKQTSK